MSGIRPVRIGASLGSFAIVLAATLAACSAGLLPPPPSVRIVTLPPQSPPDWSLPPTTDAAATFPVQVIQGVSASFAVPTPPPTRAPAPPHFRATPPPPPPPPPVPAIQPSGPAPSGTGGYIGGWVWNDANRNGNPDAGETGLANARIEIDGCSATTTVVYADATGRFGAANLGAGVCRVRVVLSGFVFETTRPSLGSPPPYPILVVSALGRASYVDVALIP